MTETLRPTNVEVDLSIIGANLAAISQHVSPALVMPVLKANAYGHGIVPVGAFLADRGADYLAVAYLEEAESLREAGVTTPILVMSGLVGRQIPRFLQANLTITVPSVEKLLQVQEAAQATRTRARVHLKVDTGMERIGIHYYSARDLLEISVACPDVEVEGVFSHFANSDATDLTSARLQLERFLDVVSFYEERSLPTPIRHMANSGAILQLPDAHLDMVRPGIMLYGVYPSPEASRTVEVHPSLTWRTQVVYFKVVKPDHPVGYGSSWVSDHPIRLVTLPVGYGDGYFRSLSNKAEVVLRGRRYPVVGRICMDQTAVNIEWETAYNGDEVVLLGRQGDQEVTADEIAEWAGTIAYEVLTNINSRVPRSYVGGQ